MQCTCIDIHLSSNMPVSICSMHCDEFSLTMIENLRHASPSPTPERNCRRSVFSHINTMRELNGQRSMLVRRKRLKLRRLVKSESNDHCAKRKRTEESENEEFSKKIKSDKASLTLSSAESNKLVENDIIIDESSSYVDEEDREREKKRRFTFWSHGSISLIGRRREMEDAVAVQLGFLKRGLKKYDFFGVYDGHGGSRVAYSCRERLHRLLVNVVEGGGGGEGNDFAEKGMINWEKVMAASFRRMDEEVNKGGSSVAMMGSTAVVAVVGEEELVVANCGDSRAVLSRDGVAIALSDDHKPDRPDELERIEVSGGKVINWNGHRVLGVLATSRSIGDHYLKPFVIPEPEVRVSKRTDKDEFLILGCDGLWDVVSNDIACQIVRRCLNHRREVIDEDAGSRAAQAAAILAELAIARGSRDNISVIVIELKKFRRSNTNLNGW